MAVRFHHRTAHQRSTMCRTCPLCTDSGLYHDLSCRSCIAAASAAKQPQVGGSLVFALMAASFMLGFLLARFNVFGALVATAICATISSFICAVISHLTLAQTLVISLATAF